MRRTLQASETRRIKGNRAVFQTADFHHPLGQELSGAQNHNQNEVAKLIHKIAVGRGAPAAPNMVRNHVTAGNR